MVINLMGSTESFCVDENCEKVNYLTKNRAYQEAIKAYTKGNRSQHIIGYINRCEKRLPKKRKINYS